ncbi:MAG: adenine methyltransferase [Clostridia bacterium]|nr:adenine methyltransferase [Clostridia bacterium]
MEAQSRAVILPSQTVEWQTPQDLFERLDAKYHFDLDVCATEFNAKCDRYYTRQDDGLAQPWNGRCWCNPPYGREIAKWVKKAAESGTLVVMLLPARTDTKWFHDYVLPHGKIEFIKGRLRFGNAKENAPFASMVVVFGDG